MPRHGQRYVLTLTILIMHGLTIHPSAVKKYSLKRTLKEQENPPQKRQRVEMAAPETVRSTLKRTIKDYFHSALRSSSSSPSTPFSSSPRDVPSSPPDYISEDTSLEQRKPRKRRRLATYTYISKFSKMPAKDNEEFHVGSPKPVSFLRDLSPSPTSDQIAGARRERRNKPLAHRTLAALADCQDLLADVVEWKSESSSDICNYDTLEEPHPGAIDIPPRKGMPKTQTQAVSNNPVEALEEDEEDLFRDINAVNTFQRRPAIAMQPATPNIGALVQTQISLGQNTNVTCQICRFSYNPTLNTDRDLHDEYHQNLDKGLSTNGLKPDEALNVKKLLSHINPGGDENFVVLVHRKSSQGWKNLAFTALVGNVDKDLGSQAITEDELWSVISLPASQLGSVATQGPRTLLEQSIDRFKVYMYVKSFGRGKPARIIAVLLAERITQGLESYIDGSDQYPKGDSFRFEDIFGLPTRELREALLGINKIWVHKRYRRRGLATTLFNVARKDFIFGHPISRLEVAWTHPTEEGARFAKGCLKGKAAYDYLSYTDKS